MIAGENQPAKGHESSNGNEVLGGEELAERTETANGDDDGEGEQAEGEPEINPLVVNEPAYEGDLADDDRADLGVRLGRLRISDRIGGQFRPKMVEELTYFLDVSVSRLPTAATQLPRSYLPQEEFLEPGPTYIVPRSDTMFYNWMNPRQLGPLPDHSNSRIILDNYWSCVHPVARVLHRPAFQRIWNSYWWNVQQSQETPKPFVALVYAVLFSGLVSMPEDLIYSQLGRDKASLVNYMLKNTEIALLQANWAGSTRMDTIQAAVIYLIPMCRAEVSRSHATFVAAAIRLAEGMGLTVDGVQHAFSSIQVHLRRLVWYQLSLLDIRTCEAMGPRPQMQPEYVSTKLPLNVDEADIHHASVDAPRWTDMTVTLIRMKCNEFIRTVWTERRLLQQKKTTVAKVLAKIESFRRDMRQRYGVMVDMDIPIQRYGRLVYEIQTLRTYAMILHQYHLHPGIDMSDRLKRLFIRQGINTMNAVMEFETAPDLAQWKWFAGAYQQHHYALALLMEVLMNPTRVDAPQIQFGLDFVFEPPRDILSPFDRNRWIVIALRDRMAEFVRLRKLRAPSDLMSRLNIERGSESLEAPAKTSLPEQARPNLADGILTPGNSNVPSLYSPAIGSDNPAMPTIAPQTIPAQPIHPPFVQDIMDIEPDILGELYPNSDLEGDINMDVNDWSVVHDTNFYPPNLIETNHLPPHLHYQLDVYGYTGSPELNFSLAPSQSIYTIPQALLENPPNSPEPPHATYPSTQGMRLPQQHATEPDQPTFVGRQAMRQPQQYNPGTSANFTAMNSTYDTIQIDCDTNASASEDQGTFNNLDNMETYQQPTRSNIGRHLYHALDPHQHQPHDEQQQNHQY